MNKLVELLNEYKPQVHYLDKPKREYKDNNFYWYKREKDIGWCFSDIYVISKKFGFIKWLVDNDKIDRLTFCESWLAGKYTDFELSYDTPREDYTNMLLMELAIQDKPIEYLISVLR